MDIGNLALELKDKTGTYNELVIECPGGWRLEFEMGLFPAKTLHRPLLYMFLAWLLASRNIAGAFNRGMPIDLRVHGVFGQAKLVLAMGSCTRVLHGSNRNKLICNLCP